MVESTLMGCWSIRKFTESRWHTVGTSARGVVVGLMSGLPGLVDYLFNETNSSQYFLGGWRRLADDRRTFIIACAFVSRVSDAVLVEILSDGRVARNVAKLKSVLEEELTWLADLPLDVFTKVARMCPLSAADLRTKCLRSAHINAAFIQDRVFAAVDQYPFCLAAGESDEALSVALDGLAAAAKPDEQVASQLWQLLRMGYSKSRLVNVLRLVRDLEWSTLRAEQTHASAAVLMRFHPDYGVDTLAARALILSTNRLLQATTDDDRRMARMEKEFAKEGARCPQRVSPQHMYIRDLMLVAARRFKGADRKPSVSQSIIRKNSEMYKMQSQGTKRRYEEQARAYRERKKEEINEKMSVLRGTMDLLEARMCEDIAKGGGMKFSTCTFQRADFDNYAALWSLKKYAGSSLKEARQRALRAPPVPEPLEFARLAEHVVWEQANDGGVPWLKRVAGHRAFFHDAAFSFVRDGREEVWRFVYARQSPIRVMVSKMRRVEVFHRGYAVGQHGQAPLGREEVLHRFEVSPMNNANASVWGDLDISSVHVLRYLQHASGWLLETMAHELPLVDFLDMLPTPTPQRESNAAAASGPRSGGNHDALLLRYPWLQDFGRLDKKGGLGEGASSSAKGPGPDGEASHQDGGDLDDDELAAVFSEVDRYRAELSITAASADATDDFAVVVLGGAWTAANRGLAADAVQGLARGADAAAFCAARGMQKSSRYEISAYSFQWACILARAWAHRMQYFFNKAKLVEEYAVGFSRAEVAAYNEPLELAAAATALSHNAKAMARVVAIRRLFD